MIYYILAKLLSKFEHKSISMIAHISKKELALVLIVCLIQPVSATAETIIASVGDSMTAGFPTQLEGNGCIYCGGYEQALETLLDGNDLPSTVYNYGVTGETSTLGAARIPIIISTLNPEYVLFMEGTNDLWTSDPNTLESRIETAINNILADNKIPIIGTLLPDTRGANNTVKDIPTANTLIRNLVNRRQVQLAELYDATSYAGWSNMMIDGLHPDSSGFQLMADVWYDAIINPRQYVNYIPAILLLLLE